MTVAAPPIGQQLKAERERRGMSTQKAADDLHLDAWVIEALEAGDYARIGPAVYAKGYLKRYAGVLGVPAADISVRVDAPAIGPSPTAAFKVPSAPRAPATATVGLVIAAVAFVVVATVAGVVWWHPWRARAASTVTGSPPGIGGTSSAGPALGTNSGGGSTGAAGGASALSTGSSVPGATSASGIADATAGGTAAGASGTPVATGPRAAPGALVSAPTAPTAPMAPVATVAAAATVAGAAPSVTPATAAQPAVPAEPRGVGHARLRLSFSADSYVEVHDSTGRRVFAGKGLANSVKTLSGEAPLRVYLGYASGVQLQVNDHAVAIGRQFVTGDVAHFEAGADGVLRRDAGAATLGVGSPGQPRATPHG